MVAGEEVVLGMCWKKGRLAGRAGRVKDGRKVLASDSVRPFY